MMRVFKIKDLVVFGLGIVIFSAHASTEIPRSFRFQGTIVADSKSECSSGKAELFIADAVSKTLIYQVDVIPGGSFEFKLKPAKYQIRVASNTDCEANYILDADGKKSMDVEIKLTPKKQEAKK